ncbi:hypothetical protein [Sphingomonas quercus]|uniref:Transposase n=1 Tax=Sphingomonas quercus TaxID=2842451 RepID=A0ABS6BLU1_9SPHN|nr:hypothetical protein [Sphingomonas quercus]MBU3078366.1 hypothetical protein [Sphingomonas quercus]
MNNDRDFGPDRERRNKAFGWWLRTGRWPAADMPDEILLEDRVERAAAIRRWFRTVI